jgi:hypothetical protein
MDFIRFVVPELNKESGYRCGIIRAAFQLQETGRLESHEEDRLNEIFRWFNKNLQIPDRISKKRNSGHKNHHGLSWFKDASGEHIGMIREIEYILKNHGVWVEMIKSDRPGYIVYEDSFQIVAEPFYDSNA